MRFPTSKNEARSRKDLAKKSSNTAFPHMLATAGPIGLGKLHNDPLTAVFAGLIKRPLIDIMKRSLDATVLENVITKIG